MQRTQQLDEVAQGLFIWQAYDTKTKADLFSTALEAPAGTYLVDPIPLGQLGLLSLRKRGKTAGVFVTNGNHVRSAAEFASTFSVPIYVHASLHRNPDFPQATSLHDGQIFSEGLTAIAIDGGPAGEMALHYNGNGGTVIFGDALINFEPYGFAFLPDKYCQDASLMRNSLRKLLDYTFERILFAHGTPIVSDGHARLQELLKKTR